MTHMAARLNGAHTKDIRDKIKTSQLINRLQDNGLAEKEFLTQGQIASINSVLDRVLPKMSAISHEGTGEAGEIIFRTVYETK